MKKILAVLAVAGGLACSKSSGTQASTSTPDPATAPAAAAAAPAPVVPVVAATAGPSPATHAAVRKKDVRAGRSLTSHKHHHRKKSASHA